MAAAAAAAATASTGTEVPAAGTSEETTSATATATSVSTPASTSASATAAVQCKQILEGELVLCSEFLTLDERNFHCWNYRRFVVSTLAMVTLALAGNSGLEEITIDIDGGWSFLDDMIIGPQLTKITTTSSSSSSPSSLVLSKSFSTNISEQIMQLLQNEWEFTSEKIYQNFSNGSAFDYRSKLLPLLLHYSNSTSLSSSSSSSNTESNAKSKSDWVQEELELIRNAIFTEPDDQTSWWYFRFILSWANPMMDHNNSNNDNNNNNNNDEVEEYKQILYEEWTSIQELVDAEGGECKWGLLGLFMIATHFCDLETKHGVHGSVEYEGKNWLELAQSYLENLKELDPDRKHRYESMQVK